jgi:hypothetical protein
MLAGRREERESRFGRLSSPLKFTFKRIFLFFIDIFKKKLFYITVYYNHISLYLISELTTIYFILQEFLTACLSCLLVVQINV